MKFLLLENFDLKYLDRKDMDIFWVKKTNKNSKTLLFAEDTDKLCGVIDPEAELSQGDEVVMLVKTRYIHTMQSHGFQLCTMYIDLTIKHRPKFLISKVVVGTSCPYVG
eukprot:UN32632